jgi:hypothetical protein
MCLIALILTLVLKRERVGKDPVILLRSTEEFCYILVHLLLMENDGRIKQHNMISNVDPLFLETGGRNNRVFTY